MVDIYPLLDRIRELLPADTPAYLVGGAVRDLLLGRPLHDLDFVLPGDGMAAGRAAANRLGGACFPLDEEHQTARVVLVQPDGSRLNLDFAAQRGADLESDLRARDFTINAIAIPLNDLKKLNDPLGGVEDLHDKRLRVCSPESMLDDPLRVLRGVRLAVQFTLKVEQETRRRMREAASLLPRVSSERVRDELFHMLDGEQPATALRILDTLDILPHVLPELAAATGVTQSAPHVHDVWSHTLSVVESLRNLFAVLDREHDPERSASWALGLVSVRLGRYREKLYEHLQTPLNPERSLRALITLAALYHDAAKPETRSLDDDGRIRFFGHDERGAEMVAARAQALRLSNLEVERLRTIVRHHLRPILLAQLDGQPSRRAVYRFFRDTGAAGVDICLLSIADVLATYGATLPQETWIHHLDTVRELLEAWWERPEESVAPPALVDGHELMKQFDLEPGPKIGELLRSIREAQAAGEVRNREEAFRLAKRILQEES